MLFRIKEATLDEATQHPISPLRRAEDISPDVLITESVNSRYHVAWNDLEIAISQQQPEAARQAVDTLSTEVMLRSRIRDLGTIATSQILVDRAMYGQADPCHIRNAYLSLAGAIIETQATQRLDAGNRNGTLAELIFMALVNRGGTVAACSAAPREECSPYPRYNHDSIVIDGLGKRAFSIKASKSKDNKSADHPVVTLSMDALLKRTLDKAAIPPQSRSDAYLLQPKDITILDSAALLITRDALTPFVQSSAEQLAMEALSVAAMRQVAAAPLIIR